MPAENYHAPTSPPARRASSTADGVARVTAGTARRLLDASAMSIVHRILLAIALLSPGTGCDIHKPGAAGPDAADPGDAADAAPGAGALLHDDFASAWSGWRPLGGVAAATGDAGRGRLVPVISDYSLARMGHPLGARDVEVTLSLTMADVPRQGVGLYVRQNGGHLQQSPIHGAGYAVFVEGFRGPGVGLWRERDGVEEELARVAVPALTDGAAYRVRFRCAQDGAVTTLAARLWPAGTPEPTTWEVTATDATTALQGVAGDLAIDAWNTATSGGPAADIYVDDLDVVGL